MEKTRAEAQDPRTALKLLNQTCVDSELEIIRVCAIKVVKDRPAKQLTVRYEVEARRLRQASQNLTLFGKLYLKETGKRTWQVLKVLCRADLPTLIFPEPIGYNARQRFLLTGGLDGNTLETCLREPSVLAKLTYFGHSLASLHNLDVDGIGIYPEDGFPWRVHDGLTEGKVLEKALANIEESSLHASVKAEFHTVYTAVADRLAQNTQSSHCIVHRDLYPRQVISCGEGRIGLVDLDEICLGEAEMDMGNFIAHLQLADFQEKGVKGVSDSLRDAFTSAYCSLRRFSESRLVPYQAASLLRLASLSRLGMAELSVLPWDRLAEELVQEARTLLVGN